MSDMNNNSIKDNYFKKLSSYLRRESNQFNENHPKASNVLLYGLIIFTTLVIIGAIGYYGAESEFPQNEFMPIKFESDTFVVNGTMKNIHNNFSNLVRETEGMKYTVTIFNKNSTDYYFTLKNKVANAKDVIYYEKNDPVRINGGEKDTFSTTAYMRNTGINTVTITVEVHKAKQHPQEGMVLMGGSIDEGSQGFFNRVYSQSDYDATREKSVFYRFLGVIAAPFVILSVKYLRDIIEND